MELKQQLRLSQQLVMTPQLQQAIRLLQMSRAELVDLVREEMLENPMLEDHADAGPAADGESSEDSPPRGSDRPPGDGEPQRDSGPELSDGAQAMSPNEGTSQEQTNPGADGAEVNGEATPAENREIDWEAYLENQSLQAQPMQFRAAPEDDMPGIDATYSKSIGLTGHMLWQCQMAGLHGNENHFAELVIGNLDDDGYLKMDEVPEEEVVPRLAHECGMDPEDAEEVLKIIQHFEPIGVGSRSLRECLRVQAEHHEMDDLVLRVIEHHIHDLENRNYANVAKELEVDVDEIYDCAQVIADLEPRPGRNFASEEPRYITPDVYVHRVGDEYFVVANDDGMPRLRISGFYRTAMADDPKAKEYIQNKLRSAQWLIRSIDQRRKTIVRVTECIVERQKSFFDQGIEHLKPMILRDVAEVVGMHESTISRVTSNKYVHTPRGLFELKFFFNSAIRRDNQSDIASESVKQAIKKLITTEDPANPHSDQKLVELLRAADVKIARRTVAKYREMLGILSSSKRKKYF